MAHIRGIPGKDFGFDEKQNLLVIPQNATSTLLIIAASGLEPVIGDDSIVEIVSGNMLKPVEKSYLSGWELAQDVRPITFRGKKQGETTFVARRMDDGRNWIAPMKIIVTDDPHYRQANGRVQVSKELTDRCRQCSTLHEAAIEIALDQLHSDLRAQDKWNTASAAYGAPGENWCGAFAFWCWSEAARLRNVENPFGKQVDVLKSPQKGICWACANSGVAR
ncbi:MAG: hypothetical protein FJ267_14780, partial [Planctomycetes bacterium]|nr:hypothetical protein [Planctomycetota bacterium]